MIVAGFFGWAAVQVVVCAVAIVRVRRAFSSRGATAPARDGVVLVRPLAGDERGLADRLVATGGAPRIVLAVADADDTANAAARHALAKLGDAATLVVTHPEGPNRKADQLARAIARAAPDARTIVVCDSDVAPTPAALDALLGAIADGTGTSAAFCPVAEDDRGSFGARASSAVTRGSLHAFAILGTLDRSLFVGKLFAIRADALRDAGGFEAVRGTLGEDAALARRLRDTGARHRIVPYVVGADRGAPSMRDTVARFARWLLVVRADRPALLATYPLLLAGALPLVVAALAVAARGGAEALGGAFAVVLARVAVARQGRTLAGARRSLGACVVDVVLADTVLLAALMRAIAGGAFTWRGVPLKVRGGALADAPTTPPSRVRKR